MIVVGGGVIGLEYAIMFATLGVQVTVVDGRERLLEFCDREIIDTLLYHARSLGMIFRLGESVVDICQPRPGLVAVELESGKRLLGETVLFSVGRSGDTECLHLERAGLAADKRGRLKCNEHFQTEVPHIYAVGDVVGFPALASASMEQGRRAVCHMMGETFRPAQHMPYGLFTIPEISTVGKNEEELTAERVPYEVGIARFSEIARGQINGDRTGMLKLLFHRDTRQLLGVHVIGEVGDRDRPHRPDRDGLRRHDRLLPRHGVQLPDDGRVLQGGGPRRPQQVVAAQRASTSALPGPASGRSGDRYVADVGVGQIAKSDMSVRQRALDWSKVRRFDGPFVGSPFPHSENFGQLSVVHATSPQHARCHASLNRMGGEEMPFLNADILVPRS